MHQFQERYSCAGLTFNQSYLKVKDYCWYIYHAVILSCFITLWDEYFFDDFLFVKMFVCYKYIWSKFYFFKWIFTAITIFLKQNKTENTRTLVSYKQRIRIYCFKKFKNTTRIFEFREKPSPITWLWNLHTQREIIAEKSVENVKKKGGRTATLAGSERKRRKREYDKKLAKSRIFIGDTVKRRRALKHKTNAKKEMADMLIERWVQSFDQFLWLGTETVRWCKCTRVLF